jgi:hypothetical protein
MQASGISNLLSVVSEKYMMARKDFCIAVIEDTILA